MAISGRCVLVVALGVVAAVLAPRPLTVALWTLAVLAAVAVDLALAAAPRSLDVVREPTPPVRLGEETAAEVVVVNTGRRRLRGVLRDAWVPSAGAGSTNGEPPGSANAEPGAARNAEPIDGPDGARGGSTSGGASAPPTSSGGPRAQPGPGPSTQPGPGPSTPPGRREATTGRQQTARHQLDLPPGERRRLRTPLRPTRRGDRRADVVAVRSWGPLGLAGRQASLPLPGVVRVLPPFASRRHLPAALERLRSLDGSASVQLRGAGTEFDALRDYVAGDDVRSIDWRATARRGDVVVRTWRPERDRHVLVVLDTSRTSAGRIGDAPRLDAAMDAALLLSALAAAAGDRVELLAVDRVVRAGVRGARGPALLPALVQAMAVLEPALVEADWGLVAAQVRRRMPHRGLLVLLTPLEAAAAEEALLPALPALVASHTVLVGSVADPALTAMTALRGDVGAVHAAAAAERSALERASLVTLLRHQGARVVDAGPDELPPRLADAYLALKAAGAL